jgi:hypothetical protein
MRRILLLLVLVLAASLASTGVASGASSRCNVTIDPSVGFATDTYRITVSNLTPDPGILEVRVDVRLLGTRSGSIYFAFLIPNTSVFFIDHTADDPSQPFESGRYLVRVITPHVHGAAGCHTVGRFQIE